MAFAEISNTRRVESICKNSSSGILLLLRRIIFLNNFVLFDDDCDVDVRVGGRVCCPDVVWASVTVASRNTSVIAL